MHAYAHSTAPRPAGLRPLCAHTADLQWIVSTAELDICSFMTYPTCHNGDCECYANIANVWPRAARAMTQDASSSFLRGLCMAR